MYEEEFAKRLAGLRLKKGVSARDMSLSIGQNPGYINTIENGKAFPTMTNFFYICEFLEVSPEEFFRMDTDNPQKVRNLTEKIRRLDEEQMELMNALMDQLLKKSEKRQG